MKKLINLVFLICGSTLLFFAFPNIAEATNNSQNNDSLNEVTYDFEKDLLIENEDVIEFDLDELSKKGSLEKKIVDENSVTHTFTIEEDINRGFGILSLKNKTYTIRRAESGVYEASFKIDINLNKIRRVHSDNIKIFRGSISNKHLLRVSDKKARLSFTQKYLLFSTDKKITATISGSTLSVTIN